MLKKRRSLKGQFHLNVFLKIHVRGFFNNGMRTGAGCWLIQVGLHISHKVVVSLCV